MNGKFIVYAIMVSLTSTLASWGRMTTGAIGTSRSYTSGYTGSTWNSTTGGGSWGGGGGGHK